jgi:uncharacterized protein YegP (UPF0339 family)
MPSTLWLTAPSSSAGAGRVIASSEHYETHRACLEGSELVRKNAPQAELDDPTAKKG